MSLIIVPTPVGNLDDITLRAIRVLRNADLVACEDTRKTAILLKRYGIRTRTVSYHSFNERSRTPMIMEVLGQGKDVALVSDAGTPGISDPGHIIVKEVLACGINVEVLPGPTAFVPAVVLSGFPCEGVLFAGFLPDKRGKRIEYIKKHVIPGIITVFYVSPHKIGKHVEDILNVAGDLDSSLSREISKLHEETIRGKLSELLELTKGRELKGELTLVIYGKEEKKDDRQWQEETIRMFKDGRTDRDILFSILKDHKVRKNEVKQFISSLRK